MHKGLVKAVLVTAGMVAITLEGRAQFIHKAVLGEESAINSAENSGSVALRFKENSLSTQSIEAKLPNLLGLSARNTFTQIAESVDELGMSHTSLQQYFDGVPVEDGQILIHAKSGAVRSINGRIAHLANVQVQSVIDEKEAFTNALHGLNIVKLLQKYPIEKVIVGTSANNDAYTLAYKVRIDGRNSDGLIVMTHVFVDAKTGKLLNQISLIAHTDVVQTANTLYSGKRLITVDSTEAGFRLRDQTRKIETFDVGGLEISDTGDYYFASPRDYYNTGSEWEEQPALMSMTLQTVTNNMLNGLGFQNGGNFIASLVTKGTLANQEMIAWPDLKISERSSARLPVVSNNVYVFPSNLEYTAGFGKFSVSKNEISDSAFFTLSSIAPGIYPWIDVAGNAGSYEIRMERNPALDAHWGMEQTHDYFKNTFNRDSYDGKGSTLKNYINGIWPVSGTQNNAAALPAPYFGMIYGLGDGTLMGPVVGLDVMGHEFTHMVTATNGRGGLRYQGESGALNESFSDIFGACIEFYVKGEDANWDIGEGVTRGGSGFLRSMSSPKKAGSPDTYKGQYWMNTEDLQQDNGGVHRNSGVQNKWFYLLVEGGSGRNDKSDDYEVSGIGIDKAQQIAYRSLTNYLPRAARFYDAYKGSLLATEDLYGDTSAAYQAVKDAWFAVGLTEADSVLGVSPLAITADQITIYPNPATHQINISSGLQKDISVQFFNIVGVPVLKTSIGKGVNSVDISALTKGIFMIRYEVDGHEYTQKLSVL